MYSKVNAMAVNGIDGVPVSVEVDMVSGLPEVSLVGDLSPEVREARERVRSALRNCGYEIPSRRVTINLAPADIRKCGTAYDLAMAMGILGAMEIIGQRAFDGIVILGELNLDGAVRPVSGILPMVISAMEAGFSKCMVPLENAAEATAVCGLKADSIKIIPVETLTDAVSALLNPSEVKYASAVPACHAASYDVDFSQVNGQMTMRRAAEVAAAGMHNILFIGAPGSGKTMIARRIPTILPELTFKESLEVTRIYSVCGLIGPNEPVKTVRPFRSPHHTISAPALVGGGSNPRPGEISLADRGVLFLDELPEFQKSALESLRQPLEDHEVSVARVNGRHTFPANIMLCAAMNPCRCGYFPDGTRCHCSETDVKSYLRRLSRPLLDRIDICVEAPPVSYKDLSAGAESADADVPRNEPSAAIRERVERTHKIQFDRLGKFNSQMTSSDIEAHCSLGPDEAAMMEAAYEKMHLSARGYHRILKVARTIADLGGCENINTMHLLEALSYRSIDDKIWG